jgi:hypothetical protein
MTDDEWLTSANWRAMVKFIQGKASDRKLRLFVCACCRRIWDLLPDDANRDLVAAVEDCPTGSFHDPELNAAIVASTQVERKCADNWAYLAIKNLGRTYYKLRALDGLGAAAMVAVNSGDKAAELSAQTELFRDIFGNPFRPVAFDPRWRTPEAVGVAWGIYDERAFDKVPLLADALMDAGCDRADILAHCRSEGPHVRGCWVVDSVLGRA